MSKLTSKKSVMTKSLFLILISCFFNLYVYCQQDSILPWKNIPDADLKMETYDADPTADAVVLQEYVELKFDIWQDELRLYYEVYQRIKILTEEGKKYAEIEIPYIGLEQYEDITLISGFTFNYNEGSVKKTKLKAKNIVVDKSQEPVYFKRFTMPEVEVGSIIEYKYTIASLNFIEPETFYFQKDIPVRISEFRANIPEFFTYKININGYYNLANESVEESTVFLNWIFRNEDPIPSGLAYKSKDFSVQMRFQLDSYRYIYTMTNIPAFQTESYIDSYLNYIYSIKLYLVKVTQDIGYYSYIQQLAWKDLTKRIYLTTEDNSYILTKNKAKFKTYPAGFILYNTNSWEDFNTNTLNNEYYGLQLVKVWAYKPLMNKISSSDSTDFSNLKSIYNFVRDSINWNNEYNIFITKTLEEVYKQKSGNSSEINFLLIQLLRKADFEVNPVLVKTRSEGIPDIDLPSLNQFNHTIAAVELNGEIILLDAIDKERPYNLLNFEDLNNYGYLLKRLDSEWIDIKNYTYSKIEYTDSIIYENNLFTTKRQINESGYYAYNKQTEKIKPLELIQNSDKLFYKNLQISNSGNYDKDLITKYSVSADSFIEEDNYSLTIYPFYNYSNLTNPFGDFYRNYPINFGYPFEENYHIFIELPENYTVNDFSKPENIILGDNNASLEIETEIIENKINIDVYFKIINYEFPVSQYYELRNLYEKYFELKKFYIYVEK